MRILLIDNTSVHISKLAQLFDNHTLTVISHEEVSGICDSYDCIVLSGGSEHSLIGNTERFLPQIELVTHTTKPVIGICFGFQLLAYTYGAHLHKLAHKIRGIEPVEIVDTSLMNDIGHKTIQVYESHSWAVSTCPNITPLITSPSGIEAFKHREKPQIGLQFHPEVHDMSMDGKRVFDILFQQIQAV